MPGFVRPLFNFFFIKSEGTGLNGRYSVLSLSNEFVQPFSFSRSRKSPCGATHVFTIQWDGSTGCLPSAVWTGSKQGRCWCKFFYLFGQREIFFHRHLYSGNKCCRHGFLSRLNTRYRYPTKSYFVKTQAFAILNLLEKRG